jgi:hypothetical protein
LELARIGIARLDGHCLCRATVAQAAGSYCHGEGMDQARDRRGAERLGSQRNGGPHLRILSGLLTLALAGCTAAATSPSPSQEPISSASPSLIASNALPSEVPSLSATEAPTLAPLPTGTAAPDHTVAPTPPALLAKLKRVDVSRFASSKDVGVAPYWVVVGSHSAALHYQTDQAKGSISVPMTTAELVDDSDGSGPLLLWDEQSLVIVTESFGEPGGGTPCGYIAVLSWRILVASIDATGRPSAISVFASGQSKDQAYNPYPEGEGTCAYPRTPNVAISGGLIAFNVERPTAGHPFGEEILIRSLADGSTVRDLLIPEFVDTLQLSGTNLVWMEYDGNMATTMPLMISTSTNPVPQALLIFKTPGTDTGDNMSWTVPKYRLSGSQLAWEGFSTGKVWLRDLATGKISQISPTGAICALEGFDGSEALMGCGTDSKVLVWEDAFSPDWVMFWTASSGDRLLTSTPGLDCLTSCVLSGGSVSIDVAKEYSPVTYWVIPVAALTSS